MKSNKTLPSDSWTGGAAGGGDDGGQGDSDDLKAAALHGLDVTVWLLILCIFTFFFILVTVTLCMHWLARRRMVREVVIVPTGPVPGCVTVTVLPGSPHIRLLAHYHTHLGRKYSSISELPLISAPRTLSAPELYNSCCRPVHNKE